MVKNVQMDERRDVNAWFANVSVTGPAFFSPQNVIFFKSGKRFAKSM